MTHIFNTSWVNPKMHMGGGGGGGGCLNTAMSQYVCGDDDRDMSWMCMRPMQEGSTCLKTFNSELVILLCGITFG